MKILKKLAMIVAVFGVLFGTVYGVVQYVLIDRAALESEWMAASQTALGRTLTIGGKAETVLLPTPHVVFHQVSIANEEGASSSALLEAQSAELALDFSELISGKMVVKSIALKEPKLELEVLPSAGRNWRMDGAAGQAVGELAKFFALDVPITWTDGVVHYVYPQQGIDATVSLPHGSVQKEAGSDQIVLGAKVDVVGQEVDAKLRMGRADLRADNAPAVPLELTLQQGDLSLKLNGKMHALASTPRFEGDAVLESPHFWAIEPYLLGGESYYAGSGTGSALRVQSTVVATEDGLTASKLDYLVGSPGGIPLLKGVAALRWIFGQHPTLQMRADIETIDVDSWLSTMKDGGKAGDQQLANSGKDAGTGKEENAATNEDAGIIASATHRNNPWLAGFSKTLVGALDLRIAAMIYHQRVISDLQMSGRLDAGVLDIANLKATLPGNTTAQFAGKWMLDASAGSTLDGAFSAVGDSFNQLLLVFSQRDYERELPEFGAFTVRTNVAVLPEQYRASELQAKIGGVGLAGAVILHRKDRPEIESFVRARGMNLDHLWVVLRHFMPDSLFKESVQLASKDGVNGRMANNRFNWVQFPGIDIRGNFLLEDFVLFERKGEQASFTLRLQPGYVALEKTDARYNGASIQGEYGLRSNAGQNPQIVAHGKVSYFDMVDLEPSLAEDMGRDEWQAFLDQPREYSGLQEYRADVAMQFGDLRINPLMFRDLSLKGTLEDGHIEIKECVGKLWDGDVNLTGTFQAGAISSFSLSMVLGGADLVNVSRAIPWLSRMTGKIGVNGQLSSSGARLRTMVENASGVFSVAGSQVAVEGFGIDVLSRALLASRTVADFVAARDQAMASGLTMFDSIKGQVNIQQGKLTMPQLSFTSKTASGEVSGVIEILSEILDLTTQFNLVGTGAAASPPPIVLKLGGKVESPEKTLDSKDLEAFVARAAAERTLRGN